MAKPPKTPPSSEIVTEDRPDPQRQDSVHKAQGSKLKQEEEEARARPKSSRP